MNQYKVMLVDDEEEVIQAISRKLNWEEMGFSYPTYAHNGIEALEMAEEQRPDVVMTDIHMPYMDGLELGRCLKEQYPNIRIIIFSGFDEFEYAKEAIRLEVDEYILKPIDAGELSKLFAKVHSILDKQLDEKQNVEKLTAYYMQSLPMLKESFFVSLVEGQVTEQLLESAYREFLEELQGPLFFVGILHVSMTEIPENMTYPLLNISVQKLAEERLLEKWKGQMFSYQGNHVVLFQVTDASRATELTNDCDQFCRLADSVCKAKVTVGIGTGTKKVTDIGKSYRGARDAVSYRSIYGSGQAINIAEVVPGTGQTGEQSAEDDLNRIFHSIKVDSAEQVQKEAQSFMSRGLKEQENLFAQRFFLMQAISELYRFLTEHEIAVDAIFSVDTDVYAAALQMEPEELTQWFVSRCLKLQECMKERRSDSTKSFVGQAIDYVHEHYADQDLSTDGICSHLGLSNAYFSTVFKKTTGKSFVGFLTDYRMEIAVDLLMNRDEKTYIIAEKVGYSDPNYFSYVFKKQFGMSPSKYKAEQLKA
ncbi:MAG: response regulator [Lachnospiraceae bacterium]|nr:response regulator [Lachnospiraceae bacterium]